MIRSFKCRQTRRLFHREPVLRIPPAVHRVALRRLRMLHRATSLQDLRVPPGNRLEALRGDRKGQHSIRVSDRYRICFVWRAGDDYEVELVDYH